ncbi:DNA polymerase III subunit delta' [Aestuariimicrobium sp. Y1814]|uniref:DNA polymerase III subunit delta' n=1 Tax=Aestuariimicrobium sp. Y1814 TaxID=3418742 RepID=UPI003DA6DB22
MTSVWDELVGQSAVVETLRRAVEATHSGTGHAMTHAWLFTGPPGSGRSNAARAFAAALQCATGGCGTCNECRTSLSGAHPDVKLVRTEKLSIGVDEVRDLVRDASLSPLTGRFQIIVVEDADRVTDRGADALLKAIEEPAPRTVWLLCAPNPDEVIITIRSRSRQLQLATPTDQAVADLLVRRDGVDRVMATYAARAAQGHIGRARALALNEQARDRRRRVLEIPSQLTSIGACLVAADNLVKASAEEAAAATAELDQRETAELSEALGMGTKGARPKNAAAALKTLEEQQKARTKRLQRDALDRVLTELTTWYRDVLGMQTGALGPDLPSETGGGPHLINAEQAQQVTRAARSSTPEQTIRRIDAILATRVALEQNVTPLVAMESLMVGLADPR